MEILFPPIISFLVKKYSAEFRPQDMQTTEFPSFSLKGEETKECDPVLYLDFINNDLTDNEHILRQRRLLFPMGNAPIRKFNVCSIAVKLELFRGYHSNIYCCQF